VDRARVRRATAWPSVWRVLGAAPSSAKPSVGHVDAGRHDDTLDDRPTAGGRRRAHPLPRLVRPAANRPGSWNQNRAIAML